MTHSSDHMFISKVSFTMMILFIYMLGCSIPVPFASITKSAHQLISNSAFSTAAIISGVNLQRISLFSVGLNPMMIAMLVIQVLVMLRLFYFDTLSQSQILIIQQIFILIFTIMQSTTIAIGLHVVANPGLETVAVVIILTAGSLFTVWLGLMNTKHGIGGTITLILFNIINMTFPNLIKAINRLTLLANWRFWLVFLCVFSLVICIFWIAFNRAYYALPLINVSQPSTKKPQVMPIGLNMGAMMTYMIGMALLMMPMVIAQNMPNSAFANVKIVALVSALLTFFLFYFFTFVQMNPREQAKNLRNSNNYILGVRPGKPTQRFLTKRLLLVAFPGALLNAIQLPLGMIALQLLGKYAAFAMIPTTIIMIVMFMTGIRDQMLILLFPTRYNHLMKEENIK